MVSAALCPAPTTTNRRGGRSPESSVTRCSSSELCHDPVGAGHAVRQVGDEAGGDDDVAGPPDVDLFRGPADRDVEGGDDAVLDDRADLGHLTGSR